LKPSNIFFDEEHQNLVLSDLGTFQKVGALGVITKNQSFGTPKYQSPESEDPKVLYFNPYASDAYSLGLVYLNLKFMIRSDEF
jgi:serine/threonine protein kinase